MEFSVRELIISLLGEELRRRLVNRTRSNEQAFQDTGEEEVPRCVNSVISVVKARSGTCNQRITLKTSKLSSGEIR